MLSRMWDTVPFLLVLLQRKRSALPATTTVQVLTSPRHGSQNLNKQTPSTAEKVDSFYGVLLNQVATFQHMVRRYFSTGIFKPPRPRGITSFFGIVRLRAVRVLFCLLLTTHRTASHASLTQNLKCVFTLMTPRVDATPETSHSGKTPPAHRVGTRQTTKAMAGT